MFDNFLLDLSVMDIENPNLFPFPFKIHLIFAAIALVFFIYRFITDKRPFQLIMAIAIPFSMTIHISENRTWFYTVGIIELIFIIAALVSVFICKKNNKTTVEEAENTAPESSDGE